MALNRLGSQVADANACDGERHDVVLRGFAVLGDVIQQDLLCGQLKIALEAKSRLS